MKTNNAMLIMAIGCLFLLSCEPSSTDNNEETEELLENNEQFANEHTARLSLDYEGIYVGTLPCADCEGIETTLEIGPSYSYVKKMVYLGTDNDSIDEASGTFRWNDEGNTITLVGVDAPNQYFVGENVLFHLDMDGNRISGDLADNYSLRKKMNN